MERLTLPDVRDALRPAVEVLAGAIDNDLAMGRIATFAGAVVEAVDGLLVKNIEADAEAMLHLVRALASGIWAVCALHVVRAVVELPPIQTTHTIKTLAAVMHGEVAGDGAE